MHDQVKKRVLSTFLETAKFALKDTNKKINYIADDLSQRVLDVDGDLINEADYGIQVVTSGQAKKIKEISETMAQAYMQNGGRFSTVLDIFNSPSLADMRNKIEQSEDEQAEREAQANQSQVEMAEAAQEFEEEKLDREDQNKHLDRVLKKYEIDSKMIQATEPEMEMPEDDNRDLEERKVANEEKKAADDLLVKMKALDQDMKKTHMQEATKKYVANKKPAPKPAAKK